MLNMILKHHSNDKAVCPCVVPNTNNQVRKSVKLQEQKNININVKKYPIQEAELCFLTLSHFP